MHVNDGDSSKFLLTSLYGETSQKTRSGKNKLQLKEANNTYNGLTWDITDEQVNINGTATSSYSQSSRIDCNIPAGTYKYIVDNTSLTYGIWLFNEAGTIIATIRKGGTSVTTNEVATKYQLFVEYTVAETTYDIAIKPMLLLDSETDTTYEPYGVMPSPDYPSEIENIEGRNKLIFEDVEETTINGVTYSIKNGVITLNGTATALFNIYGKDFKLEKEGYYTLSKYYSGTYNKGSATDNSSLLIQSKTDDTYSNKIDYNFGYSSVSRADNYSNGTYRARIFGAKGNTYTNYKLTPQLEYGSIATPYVPYNSLEFKVEGKNILPKNKIKTTSDFFSRNEDGTYKIIAGTPTKSQYHTEEPFYLPAGTYTFSVNKQLELGVQIYLQNLTDNSYAIGLFTTTSSKTFTFTEGKIVQINTATVLNYTFAGTDDIIIQLEKGEKTTDSEIHKEQVAYFPLEEGQKLMEGSYTGEDGIHNTRKQVVFDGSDDEGWTVNGTNQGYGIVISGIGGIDSAAESADAYCTHLTKDAQAYIYNGTKDNIFSVRGGATSKIYVRFDSSITTVALLREKLAASPIVIEIPLAEPETVPYTEEQQEAWNKLQSIKLFDGINNINSDAYADIKYNYVYASPSPDCPSEIENIEGRNKLIFEDVEETTINGVTYSIKNGVITLNGTATALFNIYGKDFKLEKEGYYTLSKYYSGTYNKGSATDNSSLLIQSKTDDTYSNKIDYNFGYSSVSRADNYSNGTYRARIFGAKGNTYTNYKLTPQLEKGSVATPYVPYNSLEFKVEGKNKLDLSKCTFLYCSVNSDNKSLTCSINNGYYAYVRTTELNNWLLQNKGKKITFSTGTPLSATTSIVIYGTRSNGSTYQEANETGTGKCSITIANDFTAITSIELRFNRKNSPFTDTSTVINYAMLELGEPTDYEPYKSQVAYFPLGEGEKLYKGSFLNDNGKNHERGQYIFTGNEIFTEGTAGTDYFKAYTKAVLNLKKPGTSNVICTHLKTGTIAFGGEKNTIAGNEINGNLYLCIDNKVVNSIEDLKTYLATEYANGTPVIVEYDLAEPEVVPYTEEQRVAFNSINQLYLFMGQNTIYSDALISGIYITQMTDGITTNYLNILNSKYIDIAQRNTIHPMFKIELLDIYENIVDEITGDISTDTSGSISVNYQQGVRRSISLTFIDTDSRFIPDSKGNLIWANKKFKVFVGLKDKEKDSIYWFPQGVYYFTNATSSRDGADCKTTITGVDKFGKFGSELGYNQLESTYLIPAGTNIYSAIKGILNMDIGNGQPIDPIEPILDPIYIDEVCPYDIKKSPSEYLSEILIELADVLGCDIYYDINGRLRIDNGTIDVSYSNRASIWNFSDILPEYSNSSVSTNFVDFINAVKVVGNNINDQIYEYTAYNNNPESPTRVDLIGKKMRYIDSATVYNEDRAKDYAVYKLNTLSILQLAINFSSTLLPHLDVNKIITITDKHFNYNMQRFIIQSLTIPLSYSELMTISASNVASLPYYEGGNT